MNPVLSVVIPAHNEEECIESTLEDLCKTLEKETIDIKGGSRGATVEVGLANFFTHSWQRGGRRSRAGQFYACCAGSQYESKTRPVNE